ncbi:MAG: SpoIIE family protein phosphatase [Roseiflexaceae bacterium]|nr:SpoIIE family protein phosphatase [Roseiflexaceae bacterium]
MSYSWGIAGRPKHNQSVSGDIGFVSEDRHGGLIVVVVDGLGGGEEAAKAARAAEHVIMQHLDWSLQELIQHAHVALHSTRGAVIGLLRLDPAGAKASYVGVGNIGVQVYSKQPIKPISKNGILGFRLPTLLELHYVYEPGDIFMLYSDGISARFAQEQTLDLAQTPQEISDAVLARYGKTIDDATVVTVKT